MKTKSYRHPMLLVLVGLSHAAYVGEFRDYQEKRVAGFEEQSRNTKGISERASFNFCQCTPRTVTVERDNSKFLISRWPPVKTCGFNLKAENENDKILLDCNTMALPTTYEIVLEDGDTKRYSEIFEYESSGSEITFNLITSAVPSFFSNPSFLCNVRAIVGTENTTSPSTETSTEGSIGGASCVCGKRSVRHRIVGGQAADEFEYPWAVALGTPPYCGATLISKSVAVTAAHCVTSSRAIQLYFGKHRTYQSSEYTVMRDVERKLIHPDYSARTLNADIALLFFDPLILTNEINPICLPVGRKTYEGETATAVGWGLTSYQGERPSELQEVELDVWSQSDCQAAYLGVTITNTMMCAGYEAGDKDSCQGDSGGPLILSEDDSDVFDLVGVVSWGYKCAQPDHPGVYTRVTEMREWMLEETGEDHKMCSRP